jgi:hypothetical protein
LILDVITLNEIIKILEQRGNHESALLVHEMLKEVQKEMRKYLKNSKVRG